MLVVFAFIVLMHRHWVTLFAKPHKFTWRCLAGHEGTVRTYWGHNGLLVISFDVAERHLGAFVLVELEFGVVQVRYLVKSI